MKAILSICIIICLIFPELCNGQEGKKPANEDCLKTEKLKEIFVNNKDDNRIYFRRSAIPRSLKSAISDKFDRRIRLAKPDGNYSGTNRRNPFLPSAQMVFLIKNENKYALFFRYDRGRALSGYIAFAEIDSRVMKEFEVFYISPSWETVEDFYTAINEGKVYPIKW